MGMTWIFFLGVALCTIPVHCAMKLCKKAPGCGTTPPNRITFLKPLDPISLTYSPPKKLSLSCQASGLDIKDILWVRNNSEGDSKILNSTKIDKFLPLSLWTPKLDDRPPDHKFPFTYQCLAIGKCCNEVISKPITVDVEGSITLPPLIANPRPTTEGAIKSFQITGIRSDLPMYTGFGKLQVYCTGNGDNTTRVHWMRTDKDGNKSTRNTTTYEFHKNQVWKAELLERPDTSKFPYKYQCVAENKCCSSVKSPETKFDYFPPRGGACPDRFSVKKPIDVESIPTKRSVLFTWKYDPDPEDTGFDFTVVGGPPRKTFAITARKYQVHDLDPGRKYEYIYVILFGKGCFFSTRNSFSTLPDYPSPPLNVEVIVVGNSFNVSWDPPRFPGSKIERYILSWRKTDTEDEYEKKDVLSNNDVIKNLDEFTSYSIKLQAVNEIGIGNSSIPVSMRTTQALAPTIPTPEPVKSDSKTGAIVGGIVGAVLFIVLVLIILFLIRRRLMLKQRDKSVKEFQKWHSERAENPKHIVASMDSEREATEPNVKPLPEKADFSEDISYIVLLADWEIAPNTLQVLDRKLGGGQFGIVRQGLYTPETKGDPEVVAVKVLKDGASETDNSDLVSELRILKEVNKVQHQNVIRLIGGCSIGGKLHVVTEFCPGGNLRTFLRNSRVYPDENPSKYINLTSTLNHRQLLKIAADISSGMVHLSSHKLVHRDLAARNILIGDDNMAKVSDFGLARDIEGAEEYIRNNQNLLPVKWMALESLLEGRFTTASDVWSYGVLLHEITTLGEEPYKNISPYNIVSHVGSGCRMSQPRECSDEMYEIMTNCWKVGPTERPTFEEIHETLTAMLTDSEKSYINIAQIIDEGPLTSPTEPKNVSFKDGSVRYTTA